VHPSTTFHYLPLPSTTFQIIIQLAKVHPSVKWIALTINSYSGQELDDVNGADCHLFDPSTNKVLSKEEAQQV